MSVFEPPDGNTTPDATPSDPKKKPYKKPDFLHEQVFETMALACGKVNPTQSQCRTARKVS